MIKGRWPLPAVEGDRVRFEARASSGEGVFTRCWLGIEEVWDVTLDDGRVVHVYPCFGERMVGVRRRLTVDGIDGSGRGTVSA